MVNKNYFVGVDVGSTVCKVVIVDSYGEKILGKTKISVMGNPENATNLCLKELSKKLKIKLKLLKKTALATGLNSDKISIKEKESEITCIGKGVYNLNPHVTVAVDIGSFSMKALKMDENGKVVDFMMNNKCAAGSGILLELVGEGLELDVSELADVALKAKNPISISSQCSIFAESEVISYKNEGANLSDLVAGVCNSVAARAYSLIRMLDKEFKNVVFTGGVAKNQKVVQNLEERLNFELIKLPLDPEYITAYGAAIAAKERSG